MLSMVLIQGAQMERFWPLVQPDEDQIEDDLDYSVPDDLQDVDWSPPNGELPDVSNVPPFVPDDGLDAFKPKLEPDSIFLRRKVKILRGVF